MPAEIKPYASQLWRWAWLIAACVVIAAGISYVASARLPKTYSATTTVMVGQVLQSANPQAGDFQTGQALAQTYAQLVRREPVLQGTIDALGLTMPWQALAEQVTATALPNTQLVQIIVVDNDPKRATVIADEVARQVIKASPTPQEKAGDDRRQFVDTQLQSLQTRITDGEGQIKNLQDRLTLQTSARDIQDVQNQITALQQQMASWQTSYAGLLHDQAGPTNNLTVVDRAVSSGSPISPNIALNVVVAAGIGFSLALLAVLLLEYLDDSIRTSEDANRVLTLPVLAVLAKFRRDQPLATRDIRSPLAESYRGLRSQLQFMGMTETPSLIAITSAVPGEGKTTIACNLAISLAQAGRRVILCDTDLRRPSVHRSLGLTNNVGLSTLLHDTSLDLDWALLNGPVPNLRVLTAGPTPPSPADLLASPSMKQRIFEMEDSADIVILDTPPLLPVVDGAIVASLSSSALLVIGAGQTRTELVRKAKPLLENAGLSNIGVVLNKARNQLPASYYGYYLSAEDELAAPVGSSSTVAQQRASFFKLRA